MEWFFPLDLQFKCPSKYVPETHPVGECFTGSKWYLFLFSLTQILKTNKQKTFPLLKGGSSKRSKILPTGNTRETRGSELTFAQRGSFRSPPNISAAALHKLPGIVVTAAFPCSPVKISPSPNVSPWRNKHGLINKVMANWTSSSDAGEASAGCGTPRRMFVLLPD